MDISEKQIETLKSTTLANGQNAWEFVQSRPEEAQPWVAQGILSCIDKGYRLDLLMIGWETRELRSAARQNDDILNKNDRKHSYVNIRHRRL